ncbi:hypothetical protein MIR68_011168 [Amoeboaphelidium protococcarum]|nr:hypothetical protein MIR68_011168 [Amoeboaphelidium protococcarum]
MGKIVLIRVLVSSSIRPMALKWNRRVQAVIMLAYLDVQIVLAFLSSVPTAGVSITCLHLIILLVQLRPNNCGSSSPAGVAICNLRVCEHVSKARFGIFKFLLQYGYLACSPLSPKYAIKLDLVKLYCNLLKSSRVTASGFSKTLQNSCFLQIPNSVRKKLVVTLRIFIVLERKLASEFRHSFGTCHACPNELNAQYAAAQQEYAEQIDGDFIQVRQVLDQVAGAIKSSKPVTINQSIHVALDANFKLSHLRDRGGLPGIDRIGISDPKFYVPNMNLVNSGDQSVIENKSSCSNFKAVQQVAGKLASVSNDVTGLFGAWCARRGVAFSGTFSDLDKGEKYIHEDSAVQSLLSSFDDQSLKFKIYYDIGCQWKKKLLDRLPTAKNRDMEVLVPSFHVYAHQVECQYLYSSKYAADCGKTSGELMESFWSVVGNFGYISRTLTSMARKEILDYVMGSHSDDLSNGLVHLIVERYEDASQEFFMLDQYIKEFVAKSFTQDHDSLTGHLLQQRRLEDQTVVYDVSDPLHESYVEALELYFDDSTDQTRLQYVEQCERALGISSRNRWSRSPLQFKMTKVKIVTPCPALALEIHQQLTAKRVFSNLIKTKDKKIRDFMGKFNEQLDSIFLNFGEDSVGFVKFVKKPDILHHNFAMFQQMRPVQLLHKFVHMRQRALEEMQLCRLEAINILKTKFVILHNLTQILRLPSSSSLIRFRALQQVWNAKEDLSESIQRLQPYLDIELLQSQQRLLHLAQNRNDLHNERDAEERWDVFVQTAVNQPSDDTMEVSDGAVVQQGIQEEASLQQPVANQVNNDCVSDFAESRNAVLVSSDSVDGPIYNNSAMIEHCIALLDRSTNRMLNDEILNQAIKTLRLEADNTVMIYDSHQLNVFLGKGVRAAELYPISSDIKDILFLNHITRGQGHWNVYHVQVIDGAFYCSYYCSANYPFDSTLFEKIKQLLKYTLGQETQLSRSQNCRIHGPRQSDSHSCGLFSFWYLKQVVNRKRVQASEVDIKELRNDIRARLLTITK